MDLKLFGKQFTFEQINFDKEENSFVKRPTKPMPIEVPKNRLPFRIMPQKSRYPKQTKTTPEVEGITPSTQLDSDTDSDHDITEIEPVSNYGCFNEEVTRLEKKAYVSPKGCYFDSEIREYEPESVISN